jgi:hypothetical protein
VLVVHDRGESRAFFGASELDTPRSFTHRLELPAIDRCPLDRADESRHHVSQEPRRSVPSTTHLGSVARSMGMFNRLFAKPSIATFAAPLMQAFREAGGPTELRFEPSENRIVRTDSDGNWTVNLANLYQTYIREARSRRAEYVRSTVRAILTAKKELPEEFDLARADVRPRLWLRAAFEQMRLKGAVGGDATAGLNALPSEPVGDGTCC